MYSSRTGNRRCYNSVVTKELPDGVNYKRKNIVGRVNKSINDTVDMVADTTDEVEEEIFEVIEKVSKSSKDIKSGIAEGIHEMKDEIKKRLIMLQSKCNNNKIKITCGL